MMVDDRKPPSIIYHQSSIFFKLHKYAAYILKLSA